eukprot:gene12161-biopygen6329
MCSWTCANHSRLCAAGVRCTIYRAELAALSKIQDDLITERGDDGREIVFPAGERMECEIRVALDSQSVIVALAKGPSTQTGTLEMRAWERLIRLSWTRNARVTVQYVQGHVKLGGRVRGGGRGSEGGSEDVRARGGGGLPGTGQGRAAGAAAGGAAQAVPET